MLQSFLIRALAALATCAALFTAPGALAQTTPPPPKVQVLYDAPSGTEWDKLGFAYAIMLRNLLGHFQAQVDLVPVQQYQTGGVEKYDATFYMGSAYDNQLPAAFLADTMSTTKPAKHGHGSCMHASHFDHDRAFRLALWLRRAAVG